MSISYGRYLLRHQKSKWRNDSLRALRLYSSSASLVGFGKHRNSTYAECYQHDPGYCEWVVKAADAEDAGDHLKEFAQWICKNAKEPQTLVQASSEPLRSAPSSSVESRVPMPAKILGNQVKKVGVERPGDLTKHEVPWRPQAPRDFNGTKPATPFVASGKRVLGGGQYAGLTYAHVFEMQPAYCEYLTNWAMEKSTTDEAWYWPFVAYVNYRWFQGDHAKSEPVSVCGRKDCLSKMTFVITGSPIEMMRSVLEDLIRFFGGSVGPRVTSKTNFLVLCSVERHGRGPENTTKYQQAEHFGVPIVPVAELLDEIRKSAADGGADLLTFNHGYDSSSAE